MRGYVARCIEVRPATNHHDSHFISVINICPNIHPSHLSVLLSGSASVGLVTQIGIEQKTDCTIKRKRGDPRPVWITRSENKCRRGRGITNKKKTPPHSKSYQRPRSRETLFKDMTRPSLPGLPPLAGACAPLSVSSTQSAILRSRYPLLP
ncbi:hypothetical protein LY76DRAFT_84913 [Colletotrichum caudatum]|nr:hypothetical protein LY76DRAFT_84913 [Colletotrichum caudatum]